MKKPILLLLAGLTGALLPAQNPFAAGDIPLSLRKNATRVVRQYDLKFEVRNKGEGIETEHKVITLLNDGAASENDQYIPYSNLVRVDDIEGAVYDADGQLVRKIKKSDLEDGKPFEYFVTDHRVKIIHFPRRPYPYTIEYTTVRKFQGLMFYPIFTPQQSATESVETASFELIMPPGLEVRVRELNLPLNSQKTNLHWTLHHLEAIAEEPFMPQNGWIYPLVLCSPTQFTLEGYDGDLTTWESFSRYIGQLNAGKDALPAETVEKLRQLTADCADPYCKVERVYAYLQENTRYFNIALGIGGWQPMSASEVDRFKYGDCKGLSNYTVAMLRAVGVPACYAIIRAGDDEQNNQFPDFPNAWFNHAIACVPLPNDTIWLECTSQQESCGFNNDFTDNRFALLIGPSGGKLVRTPRYDEKVNTIHRQTKLSLASDGSAVLVSNDVYRGIATQLQAQLAEMDGETRKKALYEILPIRDFEIKNEAIHLQKGRLPEAQRNLELSIPKFASTSGKRLFVPVVGLSAKIDVPVADSTRQFPVQAHTRGYTEEDHLEIILPEGYRLENELQSVAFSTAFGSFEWSVKSETGRLLLYRKLVLNSSIQPKTSYEILIGFLKNIAKADKTKLVLVKST